MGKYESWDDAIAAVRDARLYQMKEWPNTQLEDAGGRPFEEWALMLHHYVNKLTAVYTETPGNDKVTNLPNVEGRARIKKYSAIVANLALWAVQSASQRAGDKD